MVIGRRKLLFGLIALSLLFMVIGAGTSTGNLVLAGVFIFPMTAFWAAFFESEDKLALKITYLAIAGLFVIGTVRAFFGWF